MTTINSLTSEELRLLREKRLLKDSPKQIKCGYCGKAFVPKRLWQGFCSPACRNKHHRELMEANDISQKAKIRDLEAERESLIREIAELQKRLVQK